MDLSHLLVPPSDFLAREKTSQAFRDALHDQYKSSNSSKKKRRQAEQAERFMIPHQSSSRSLHAEFHSSASSFQGTLNAHGSSSSLQFGGPDAFVRELPRPVQREPSQNTLLNALDEEISSRLAAEKLAAIGHNSARSVMSFPAHQTQQPHWSRSDGPMSAEPKNF